MQAETDARSRALYALPESRDRTEGLVSTVLEARDAEPGTVALCRRYFVDGLANGRAALEPIADDTDDAGALAGAIAAVQSAVVEGHAGRGRVASELPEDPPEGAVREFVASVTEDTATLAALTDDGDEADAEALSELRSRADGITDSTTEIETLAGQQSDNMAHLSAEVGDISGAVEEIAATSAEVSGTSDEAQRLAERGCEEATELEARMERIHEGVEGVLEAMAELESKTDEIDRVVEVIDDIADETNILALNASIEAARADGGSEGFAVVADEVKSLAEQSKTQAGEIEGIVGTIQERTTAAVSELRTVKSRTDEGLEDTEAAMETFDTIASLTAEVAGGLDEIEAATDEQASSSEELAMMIDEAASKSERMSEEITEISADNEKQLRGLEELLDGGGPA